MNIKTGYKQTEIGVIPDDWEVKNFGDVLKVCHGKSQHDVVVTDGEFPILATGGEIGRTNHYLYNKPSVLIGRKGTIDAPQYVEKPFWTIDTLFYTEISEKTSTKFIFYKFQTINWRGYNEASGVPSLNASTIERINFANPTLPEQTAIAAALSDVDALMGELDKLIAKKRDIKQATMQQLLTGKKRLAGFSGEWEVKRVCMLGDVVTGGTPSTTINEYWGDEYPWVTPTDISTRRDMNKSERQLTQKGLNAIRRLPKNTVLITCIASIGKNAILKTEGGCNQQINALIPNAENHAEFLYYLFEISKQYLQANAGTTATSIISKATFSELTFSIPTLEEQTAIATILSDMDAEINVLQQKRDKTAQLKQGMMQELLTGRIRLTNTIEPLE